MYFCAICKNIFSTGRRAGVILECSKSNCRERIHLDCHSENAMRCHSWDVNHIYLYDYTANMETNGETDNAVQVAGLLSIRVVDSHLLVFQMKNVSFNRHHALLPKSPFQLETPFHVFLRNSTVESLAYTRPNINHWVIGVHQGIASLFSLRYPDREDFSLASDSTYSAMEEEVTGTCNNNYDWLPLEENDNPIDNKFCQTTSGSRYQLFKTRDFDNCTHIPMYNFMAPAGWRCRPGSAICENVQSRSLVEKVELCKGRTRIEPLILKIDLREDWISQTWGAKNNEAKPRRVSVYQQLKLIEKCESQKEDDIEDWVYSRDAYQQQSLVYSFEQLVTDSGLGDKETIEFLEAIKELRSVAFHSTKLVNRRASSLRKIIFNRLRSLSSSTLATLTEQARRQLAPQEWSVYVQQMATLGSITTLDLFKQLVEREEITKEDIMNFISGFSMFLREPNNHVLGQLLALLDLKAIRREQHLRQTAMVSLASFFRTTCIDQQSAETRFPSQFLDLSIDDAWPKRLVARLAIEILHGESGDRSAALSALNILGHPSLIPVVIPLIEGKENSDPAVRTKAVLALHKLAHHGDATAIKILHTVYANPSENYQVRLAAFTLLMLSCPPDHVWQSVAVRTWFEPRSHVSSFVYTTLDTLASFRSPLRFLQKLSLKAKKVLKLAKPVTWGRSATYIWSYEKRRRLLASYLRLETFASKASVFPKEIYGRLNFNLGAVDFDFLEFEIHGHHMESILSYILGGDETGDHRQCRKEVPSKTIDALLDRIKVSHSTKELGEGFLHWTIMESVEKFWSFDSTAAKILRGYLDGTTASIRNVDWFHQLPLVNVDIRWANSMGFVTEVRVTGQITAAVNGTLEYLNSSNENESTIIRSHLNPTLALEAESSVGVYLSGSGIDIATSSSSVLMLASLPGWITTRLSERPAKRIDVKWSVQGEDDGSEFILLHKSHCLNGVCLTEPSQVVPKASETIEWDKKVLEGVSNRNDGNGQVDWQKLLSTVSFSWLPDKNMAVGWRQFSWRQSSHPTVFQFSVQLDRKREPVEWIMTSGTTDLHRTSPIEPTRGEMTGIVKIQDTEVTGEGKASEDDLADFIKTAPEAEEKAKPIGLNAATAIGSPSPSWLELPAQVMRTVYRIIVGQQHGRPSKPEQRVGNRLLLRWNWLRSDNNRLTSDMTASEVSHFYVEIDPAQYIGECHIRKSEISTFDEVIYDPHLGNECQYMAVAAAGTERKAAILLDRGQRNQNQALRLVVSNDDIRVDLAEKKLTVNQVTIPLVPDGVKRSRGDAGGFTLHNSCQVPFLHAWHTFNSTLEIELPLHGFMVQIRSEDDILIKAAENLGGQVQGLCGDMNGERLFEFRGPHRCVLSSGSLMASLYETSNGTHCSISKADNIVRQKYFEDTQMWHDNPKENCPRQEGSPTTLKMVLMDVYPQVF